MTMVLAVLAAVAFGGADFLGGVASRRAPAVTIVVTSHLAGLAVVAAAAPLFGQVAASTDFLWGAAAGSAGATGLVVFYRALATTRFTVAAPAAALLGALVPVGFGVMVGERPEAMAWAGVCLALPALILVGKVRGSREAAHAVVARRAVMMGALAGSLFGLFGILISRTGADSGVWPLVGARMASVPLISVLALSVGRPLLAEGKALWVAIAAGATDMVANMMLLSALHRPGLVSLVILVSSMYPAVTVLLARLVLEERIGRGQMAGLLLAGAGIGLISLS